MPLSDYLSIQLRKNDCESTQKSFVIKMNTYKYSTNLHLKCLCFLFYILFSV